ncbi:MAG: hypothetical protein Q8942_02835 [Bacillota bacterium]|nr:hypothetical protein [Bacillota bacterium]
MPLAFVYIILFLSGCSNIKEEFIRLQILFKEDSYLVVKHLVIITLGYLKTLYDYT